MKILKIEASRDAIRLYTDADGAVMVRESVPTVWKKPGRTLSMTAAQAKDGVIELSRMGKDNDRIFSRFTVYVDGKAVEGVSHVTDISAEVPEAKGGYPKLRSIKTFGADRDIMEELGIEQARYDINQTMMMTAFPTENTIPFEHNGRTYYFLRDAVEKVDELMRSSPIQTPILLNCPRLFESTGEVALLDACIHPDYDWTEPTAFISAFNVETEEGLGYYGAFCEFLADRYKIEQNGCGRVVGFIISNEVCSQYMWGNAGEMPVEQYAAEYTQALRTAWLCGKKHIECFRVYISLDHHWCNASQTPRYPLRTYPGRDIVEQVNANATRDGDFYWGIAHHPYPENLSYPDFWNDRMADFTFSTQKITFKNMEVLEAFLSQEKFLYRGEPRRILFSEQGFNSRDGELQELTEQQAAAGYVLAFMKARKMKTCDMFTHHAYIDSPHEFGLNLGMFRYDASKPNGRGEAKPVYASIKAMETPDEPAAVEKARDVIGPALFDYLLDPPLLYGDRDTSEDNAFG